MKIALMATLLLAGCATSTGTTLVNRNGAKIDCLPNGEIHIHGLTGHDPMNPPAKNEADCVARVRAGGATVVK